MSKSHYHARSTPTKFTNERGRIREEHWVVVQFGKLTTTAYQRLAICLRIAGLQADVHRRSDESFIKLTHYRTLEMPGIMHALMLKSVGSKKQLRKRTRYEIFEDTGPVGEFRSSSARHALPI